MKLKNKDYRNLESKAVICEDPERLSCEEMAEIMRKKYRYRELILSGRLVLPHGRAAQLLGPDCLYRLYSVSEAGGLSKSGKRCRRRPRR